MFARAVVQTARPAVRAMSTKTGPLNMLYNNVWRKSNMLYITYVLAGVVVIEAIYGNITNGIWDANNKGKQYKDVDWSKFKTEDDEE